MKVKGLMTQDAKAIWLTESLANAAKSMWENDCGILPVIKDGRKVVGMITDRDICMAAAMRERSASAISVEEVITGKVFSVKPDDEIEVALHLMQEHKVRRLPVLGEEGELRGVLSINDVVMNARPANGKQTSPLSYANVVKTYKAICEHPVLEIAVAATAAPE